MSKKIAVLITDEFEDSEFTSPADEFRKAGHEVITIEKQAGKTVKGKKGEASVTIDKSIDEVTPAEFDALLLPGGHSPDYLRGDNRFVTFTRDFVNSGKPVFAICHGPQLLISADVIRGRKLTAHQPRCACNQYLTHLRSFTELSALRSTAHAPGLIDHEVIIPDCGKFASSNATTRRKHE